MGERVSFSNTPRWVNLRKRQVGVKALRRLVGGSAMESPSDADMV